MEPCSLVPNSSTSGSGPLTQLGANAHDEVLEPGRVPDCYLGLLLPPTPVGEPEAGIILIVGASTLLHPVFPSRPAA